MPEASLYVLAIRNWGKSQTFLELPIVFVLTFDSYLNWKYSLGTFSYLHE